MAEEQTSPKELKPGQADCDTYYICFFKTTPPSQGTDLYDRTMRSVHASIRMDEKQTIPQYVISNFGKDVGEKLNEIVFLEITKTLGKWILANCHSKKNQILHIKGRLYLRHEKFAELGEKDAYRPRLEISYGEETYIKCDLAIWHRTYASYFVLWDEGNDLNTDTDIYDKVKPPGYIRNVQRAGIEIGLTDKLMGALIDENNAQTFGKIIQRILEEFLSKEGKLNDERLIALIEAHLEKKLYDSRTTDPCANLFNAASSAPSAKEYVGSAEVSYGKSTIFAVWPDRDQWRKAIFSADKVRERYYRPLFGHASKEESKPASLRIYSLPTAKIGEILQGNLKAPTIEEETFIDPTANVAKTAFYTDFLVQSYTCNKADATQTLPTFGDTHLFFMNNPLTNISVNGIVMNTTDFPWKDRLLLYYDMLLKGSALVPQEKVAVLLLDGWAHIGFITNLQITNTAERENAADFIFNFISLLDIPSPSTTQQIVNEPEGNYELEKQELGEIPETKVYGDYAGYKKETPILRLKHKSIVDRILSAIVPGLNTRTIRKLSNAFEGIRKFGWRGAWGQAQNFSRDYKIAKNLGISMFDYDVRLPNK